MKRGFFSAPSPKPSTSMTDVAPVGFVKPPTFCTSPLDNPTTTLHWSFHVNPSFNPPSSVTPATLPSPINRASPTNPIASIALHVTSNSIKILKPQISFNSPLPSSSSLDKVYQEVDVKGKGRGLITTRTIKEGETLFFDRPLIIFDSIRGPQHRSRAIANAEFTYAIAHLTLAQQKEFYRLDNAYAGGDKALGIIDTNAASIITLPEDDVTYSGVFPAFARINHSCDPNVGIEFDAKVAALRVFAIKDIQLGDEIETTYIVTAQMRRERRSQLMHQYRFECNCAWCSLSDEESAIKDEEREKMAQAFLKFLK